MLATELSPETQEPTSQTPLWRPLQWVHQIGHKGKLGFWHALAVSLGLHALVPVSVVAVLLLTILAFGLDWPWDKVIAKTPNDMTFILVGREALDEKPNRPTRFYADKNHRAKKLSAVYNPTEKQAAADNTIDLNATQTQPATLIDSEAPKPTPEASSKATDVDAVAQAQVDAYWTELKKRIVDSWQPPRGNESKEVVVLFSMTPKGELSNVEVTQSSGFSPVDSAAVNAIKRVFPFRPLPSDQTDPTLDIEFKFDYSVFGDKQQPNSLSPVHSG